MTGFQVYYSTIVEAGGMKKEGWKWKGGEKEKGRGEEGFRRREGEEEES